MSTNKTPYCPIALSINYVGDKWTLIVLRDMLLLNKTRFKEFKASRGKIATNILSNRLKMLLDEGYVVLGCSADSPEKHIKFIEKYDLPFPLISDESKEVLNAFGVWGPKKFMGKEYDGINRTTFVIDENGVIEDIITKVKTKEHTAQIIK